ncbi:amidohydrolase family protein [Paenibacillus whitsoniae]|uniref:Amidohydrolase n=1 Tax=Paenibacillus whitsoniae TaxID=2496558 RepID=A0A3S0A1J6_9BACL|nr:amidohydrolase family protein [Paenibacillus whitsoniae]RTE06449.1 amidohydrolase [Paenibacillus whitsoniae]
MDQWLCNVQVNGTLQDVHLLNGVIHRMVPAGSVSGWDAREMLMLPLFKDAHVHLDKAFPDQTWISRRRVTSLFEQFQMEKHLLAEIRTSQKERARAILQDMLENGTSSLRVHVDIDPEIGLSHLAMVQELQAEYQGILTMEIVAFPQQGLLRSHAAPLIEQAMQAGASIVGGVDPAGVDLDIERCLKTIFDISTAYDAEVDIHLHDPGHLGLFTIKRIMAYTEQYGKQGQVTVSHAYCLGEVSAQESLETAKQLAELDIAIVTSVPIDSAMPRIEQLTEAGVRVALGSDHTGLDAWTPFGFTDLLQRARRLADMHRWHDDARLRSVFTYLGSTASSFRVGDSADFSLVRALNCEHAAAIAPPREIVCIRGVPVAGRQRHLAWHSEQNKPNIEERFQ